MGAQDHLVKEWSGVLVPAVAWAADLGVSYAVVKWTCNHNGALLLYAITLCALVMIAVGALAAIRTLALVPASAPSDGGHGGRVRFMGMLGLLSSALFATLVIATAIPQFALRHVCW
ncbi:MAG: hypothetical protein DMG01_08420 [Acidobacteria bacterium]|nr:MAG: hypothetical protein DMG01_08420 [Acidobacteriota bacterium]